MPVRILVPSTDAPGHPFCKLRNRLEDKGREDAGEIPDDDHELVIEQVCAIDVAKAPGKVCVGLPRPSWGGRRISRVWDVEATTGNLNRLSSHFGDDRAETGVTLVGEVCEGVRDAGIGTNHLRRFVVTVAAGTLCDGAASERTPWRVGR
jgi:hypothetical protein